MCALAKGFESDLVKTKESCNARPLGLPITFDLYYNGAKSSNARILSFILRPPGFSPGISLACKVVVGIDAAASVMFFTCLAISGEC